MGFLRLACLLLLAGCEARLEDVDPTSGGNPRRGRDLIAEYGCGSCHSIPGITGADATVGPPLGDWRKRTYIAGRLRNTPAELVRWIVDPRSVDPHTAMPAVGVDEKQARDIAAYLYSR